MFTNCIYNEYVTIYDEVQLLLLFLSGQFEDFMFCRSHLLHRNQRRM